VNLKAVSYGFYERVYRPVGPMGSLCDPTYNVKRRKNHSALGKPQNEPCTPDFPVHTRWVVCGTPI